MSLAPQTLISAEGAVVLLPSILPSLSTTILTSLRPGRTLERLVAFLLTTKTDSFEDRSVVSLRVECRAVLGGTGTHDTTAATTTAA